MSTNLSLHGQECLQDIISRYTQDADKHPSPFTLKSQTNTQSVLYFCNKLCTIICIIHNVNMWVSSQNSVTCWNNFSLMLQFRDLHSPGVSKHTINIWNTAWWMQHQLGCNKTIQHKFCNDFPHFNHMEIQLKTAIVKQYEIPNNS